MRILLDTNILIRAITKDEKELTLKAQDIIRGNKCVITSPILAETIFVLFSFYKYQKEQLLGLINFLDIANFELEEKDINLKAINLFCTSNLSYIDSWLYFKSKSTSYKVATFDQNLKRKLKSNSI